MPCGSLTNGRLVDRRCSGRSGSSPSPPCAGPAPMWKLTTAPDSLKRSHIGCEVRLGELGQAEQLRLVREGEARACRGRAAGSISAMVRSMSQIGQDRLGDEAAARLLLDVDVEVVVDLQDGGAVLGVLDGEDVVRGEPDAVGVDDLGEMPIWSRSARRSFTSQAAWSMSSNGCTTWEPRTFSRPMRMVLPPVLAQSSSSRYQPVRPSMVFWTGTRSFIDVGSPGGPQVGRLGEVGVAVDDRDAVQRIGRGGDRFRALGECHS